MESCCEFNFGFAFNDSNFSDRVLRIEIADCDEERHCNCNCKRRRESGDEAANNNDSNWTMDCSADTLVRVKTLHISSPILAAKSPFFYKLFSNGMSESEQRYVTLKINASEEVAFMELLNFMYTNTLNVTAALDLLDVLMTADKFGVSSCMRYCTRLLLNLPMTPHSALLYLELPHTVLMADAVRPLTDAAKQYLTGRYKDITKSQEEVMALVMESKLPHGASCSDCDFGFAFNDSNFSNRVLRIEIMTSPVDAPPNSDIATTIDDRACNRKRRRKNIDEQILNGNQADIDDGVPYKNEGEEAVEEFPSGNEAAKNNDSNWTMDCSVDTVVRVKTLHVSSPILAAKSPFFYKLFTNGTRESEQRHVTLRINASEEAAFMELLNFMYNYVLNTTSVPALRDVLMAADKFEVSSCMRYCTWLPMTPGFALLYLELPHTVLMADAVRPLTDAAKQHLVGRYKDITKFRKAVMALPLSAIEVILASDDLQVASEDVLYDFVLKWARKHYNIRKERRKVLGTRLMRFIRFPYMTCQKLKKVLTCIDFEHKEAFKLVHEALLFKAEAPYLQRSLAAEKSASLNYRRFVERAYKHRPVKVVEFKLPRQQCVVYLDLKREECATLFPSGGYVKSQTFHLGGQGFFLVAECSTDQESSFHCFGVFLVMQKNNSVGFSLDYEFAARSRPTKEFVSKFKRSRTFTTGREVFGCKDLFAIPWTSFMAEDSPFFIKGVLHLRAQLTIKH